VKASFQIIIPHELFVAKLLKSENVRLRYNQQQKGAFFETVYIYLKS